MRNGPMVRSLAAATLVSLGAAAVPATAQESPLPGVLQPVIDLLDDDDDADDDADDSGPGNARDRDDPPPPAAPPPPMTPTVTAPAGPGASTVPAAPGTPAPPATPASPAAPPPPAPPARPMPPVSLRYLVGRHLLRPAPGTVVGGLRPTLRWRGGPARADL
jgi:hypothetical protein